MSPRRFQPPGPHYPHANHQPFHAQLQSARDYQVRLFVSRLHVFSNGDCDTGLAAPAVDTNIPGYDLGPERGVLYRARGTVAEESGSQYSETEFTPLPGQYRTTTPGFWVVFLDGMRWYPRTLVEPAVLNFGAETRRTPTFITSQGVPLGNIMLQPEAANGPLFSFIPRNRSGRNNVFDPHSFYDEPSITRVCIQDHQDGLMVVPNGRLMIWILGSRNNVPWHYFNMLRQRAGRINTPDLLEYHPDPQMARVTEVPDTIRQVVREIGEEVPLVISIIVVVSTNEDTLVEE